IILNPVAGCRAKAGLGGSNGGIVGLSVTQVQPHLVVGDVEAGQCLIPQRLRRIITLTQSLTTARRAPKNPPPGLDCRRSGYARLPSAHPRRILILIDAALSP